MIVVHPMSQAVENHLSNDRMISVDRVAATRIVFVISGVVFEHVVNRILKPFKAEHGAFFVAFASVIEDHIEDDFDAGFVKRLHHLFEFGDLSSWRFVPGVTAVRSEESHRVVAPVVGTLELGAVVVVDRELMDRHQFNRRDAKRLEVRDLVDHAKVRAGMFAAAGFVIGETANVHLVDYGLRDVCL